MALLQPALVAAAFLCSLVAGLLFSFAVVVMPGIGRLDDRDFLGAFQAIDRVIQNNQPLFIVAWVGSVLALLAACHDQYSAEQHGQAARGQHHERRGTSARAERLRGSLEPLERRQIRDCEHRVASFVDRPAEAVKGVDSSGPSASRHRALVMVFGHGAVLHLPA